MATLTEIETHWSLVDLMDAHEVLDVAYEAERFAIEQAKSK